MFPNRQAKLVVTAVCMVLGLMLAAQFRTTQELKASLPYQRVEDLTSRLTQTEKERDALRKEVQRLKEDTGAEVLTKEIQQLKMNAGVVAVSGPGVVVSMDDSKKSTKPGENPNLYLIHDDDLLKVINELWAAGAEAIAINEQRLIASSEIRCAGPTVSVNNSRFSPPYVIRAIGDPKSLEASLKMRGGVIETLKFWGIQVTVSPEENVLVPAFKGTFRFDYAKAVQEGKL